MAEIRTSATHNGGCGLNPLLGYVCLSIRLQQMRSSLVLWSSHPALHTGGMWVRLCVFVYQTLTNEIFMGAMEFMPYEHGRRPLWEETEALVEKSVCI